MPEVRELGFNVSGTNVALVTTAETVIVTSPVIALPLDTHNIVILGWAVLTTGTSTTTVTPRIRRGAAVGGTLVGEANAEAIKVAVAAEEPFMKLASEFRQGVGSVQYSFTLEQAAAAANGTALEAGILVFVL